MTARPRFNDFSLPANALTPKTAIAIALFAGVLATFVRWYFVVHAQVLVDLDADSDWGDAAQFYRYAWHLVHSGIFSSDTVGTTHPTPDGFRDPAYPVFMALGMLVTSEYSQWYGLLLLAQAVLGGVAVTCVILAMRDTVQTWLLVIAALTMALWPHLVAITAYVMSENLTTPFCAIALLAISEAARRQSMGYTIAGGLALSIAALSNSVLGPLIVLLIIAFAWKRIMSRRLLLVLLLVTVTPLLAWGARNATLQTIFTPGFRAEVNLVQGSWPTYHVASQLQVRGDPVGIETINAINFEIGRVHLNRLEGLNAMAARMSTAPWTYAKWYMGKPALTWGWEIALGQGDIYVYPTRNSPFMVNPIFKGIEAITFMLNGVIAILALGGIALTLGQKSPSAAMLTFAITTAWITLAYWVFQSDARYSIPFRPEEIALACLAISGGIAYLRHRRGRDNPTPVKSVTS
jgi:4-amino-4-deoxy-L-arabinose transferase-like glycosyltransferase